MGAMADNLPPGNEREVREASEFETARRRFLSDYEWPGADRKLMNPTSHSVEARQDCSSDFSFKLSDKE
jgi:hypothetical protein